MKLSVLVFSALALCLLSLVGIIALVVTGQEGSVCLLMIDLAIVGCVLAVLSLRE